MPWTPSTFKSRHNKDLTAGGAKHAAKQANAILRSGASEGIAIATASKFAKEHGMKKAEGGVVATTNAQVQAQRVHDQKEADAMGRKSRNRTGNDLTSANDLGKKKQKPPGVRW
jgi:uncharacterized protein YdaT